MKKWVVILASVLVVCIIGIVLFVGFLFPIKFRYEIKKYANEYGLSANMIASIINIESGFDVNAKSSAGAIGLMQILPSTARECANKMGIEFQDNDLYDGDTNIRIGCFYLQYLMTLFDGNITNVLCAYNWGLGNVNNWIEQGNVDVQGTITNIPVEETRNYIKKFHTGYFVYEKLYGY